MKYEPKTCAQCRVTFCKAPKETRVAWHDRRFCSRRCAARSTCVPAFFELVKKTDACWLWLGPTNQDGYGFYSTRAAHRVSHEIANGPIPQGMSVLHRCDNPPCVNPAHLFLGTQADNVADCVSKGRRATKLVPEVVAVIRRRCADGERQRAVAREFGVSDATVSLIVNRKTWEYAAPKAGRCVIEVFAEEKETAR